MLRVSAIEKALPDDVRRIAREHPFVAITAATVLGFYLGRSHGRAILTALVGVGISAGSANARKVFGIAPARR
jgi:hypothetical protein